MRVITPPINLAENVICFSTTVDGGVSSGAYESLNLAHHVQDTHCDVSRNRQILNDYIKGIVPLAKPAVYMNQQHTTIVQDIDNSALNQNLVVDGVCTSKALQPLAVMTADCLPIVMSDGDKIAAIHAGWRGLVGNILGNAIANFSKASSISVWVGPAISCANFEVGDDIIALFGAHAKHVYPARSKNKKFVDLKMICRDELFKLGVTKVSVAEQCTYRDKYFFSHRRTIHSGLENTGRNATFILKTT